MVNAMHVSLIQFLAMTDSVASSHSARLVRESISTVNAYLVALVVFKVQTVFIANNQTDQQAVTELTTSEMMVSVLDAQMARGRLHLISENVLISHDHQSANHSRELVPMDLASIAQNTR